MTNPPEQCAKCVKYDVCKYAEELAAATEAIMRSSWGVPSEPGSVVNLDCRDWITVEVKCGKFQGSGAGVR